VVDLDEGHQSGAGEMLGHAPGAQNRVALLGSFENAGVVAVREPRELRLIARVRPLEQPVALGVVPEVAEMVDQSRAGAGIQREVKASVRLAPRRQIGLAHRGRPLEERQLGVGELGLGELRHGQADREALEGDAHRVQILEVLGAERTDPDAASSLRAKEALHLQQPHRLAQRRAAHPQLI
jgi:hypothetical protein